MSIPDMPLHIPPYMEIRAGLNEIRRLRKMIHSLVKSTAVMKTGKDRTHVAVIPNELYADMLLVAKEHREAK